MTTVDERGGNPVKADWNYWRLWRKLPAELLYIATAFPLAVVGFIVVSSLLFVGFGSVAVFVGFFFITAALYLSRGLGDFERSRLRWSGRPAIQRPEWGSSPNTSFMGAVFAPFVNGHYWLYLLYGSIVAPLLSGFTWTITVVWTVIGVSGVSSSFVSSILATVDWSFFEWFFVEELRLVSTVSDPTFWNSIGYTVVGFVFLATLPYLTRGSLLMHHAVAVGLLGPWRSEALQREVADLSASRGAAVVAEDRSLRKLERDIHDGPQQRLVRLQMDLSTAERRVDSDPASAKAMIGEARVLAKEALDELRALSRGFAPPILQDRGLGAAIDSLVSLSPVPVVVEGEAVMRVGLPSEIERSAYFVVSELLTNVSKHSGATEACVHLALRADPRPDVVWLDVWVLDNGQGGASLVSGHGLSGLEERVRGLRGILALDSPLGGPTSVGVHVPVARDAIAVHPASS